MKKQIRSRGMMRTELSNGASVIIETDTKTNMLTVDFSDVENRMAELATQNVTLIAANEELKNLCDRLKQQAVQHSGESRCQTSTVHEMYQLLTGGKGEPATWNGALPMRRFVQCVDDVVAQAKALNTWLCKTGRCGCAEQQALENALNRLGIARALKFVAVTEDEKCAEALSKANLGKMVVIIGEPEGHTSVYLEEDLLPPEERTCWTIAKFLNGEYIKED